MKTKTLLIFALSNFAICTTVLGQIQKQTGSLKAEKAKVTISKESNEKEITSPDEIKTQLLQDWKFRQITLVTPKDGYLMHIAEQEVHLVKMLIANYSFNEDGTITLDPTYMEKLGVKEAKWEMKNADNLEITYYWTAEKQKAAEFSDDNVKLKYNIDVISEEELILNWNDMFIVKLIIKTK